MAPLTHRDIIRASATAALAFSLAAATGRAQDTNTPGKNGYLPAIRQELARLELDARCDDTTSTCRFTSSLDEKEGHAAQIVVHYSLKTNTVYMYVDRFIALGRSGPSAELALRLLDLNRELVTAKFEWDKASESIRLSATLNTDSNFDRRAFRSQLTGIIAVAKKVGPVLTAYAKEESQSAPRTIENEEAD